MVDDRGRAPLRPRRPGQYSPRSLARPEPAHLPHDGQDDREVRRGRPAAASRRWGVPDAGRIRVDQRGGAGAHRAGALTSVLTPVRAPGTTRVIACTLEPDLSPRASHV